MSAWRTAAACRPQLQLSRRWLLLLGRPPGLAGARGAAFPPTSAGPRVGTAQPDESPQRQTRKQHDHERQCRCSTALGQDGPGLEPVQPAAGTAVAMGLEPGHPHAALPCRADHPRLTRHPSHPCLLFCSHCTVGSSRVLQLRVTSRPAHLEMATNQSEQSRQSNQKSTRTWCMPADTDFLQQAPIPTAAICSAFCIHLPLQAAEPAVLTWNSSKQACAQDASLPFGAPHTDIGPCSKADVSVRYVVQPPIGWLLHATTHTVDHLSAARAAFRCRVAAQRAGERRSSAANCLYPTCSCRLCWAGEFLECNGWPVNAVLWRLR